VPGSAIDRANKASRRDPFEQARLLLLSSEDHLHTILMVLQGNTLPIFSLYSLLRPAAEAGVRIADLLDSTIDETVRLGRGLNARLENLDQQNKVRPNPTFLATAIAKLEAKAVAHGVTVIHPKKGGAEIVGFGDRPKSGVDLFSAHTKEGALMFRFLSAHIHSMPWIMLSASKAVPTAEPGVSMMPNELDVSLFTNVLMLVLELHQDNLVRLLAMGGYPSDIWEEGKKTAMERARARYLPLLRMAP
jgi:hypothetical protein